MGFKLNLTADEIKNAQGEYTPIAEGTYGAVIFDAKFGEAKTSKNPMYTLTFKITDGPDGAEVKRTIKGYFTLTNKALFKVIELHKAIDFPYPKKGDPAGEFEFPDANEYVGEKVNIVIAQEPYESVDDDGNDITAFRSNVKFVRKYDADKVEGSNKSEEKSGLFL